MSESSSLDIAIVGAGPGGLMAALRLHQQGLRPHIYEAVTELKPLGVGIDVKVYATKELDELGLLDEFRAISVDARDARHGALNLEWGPFRWTAPIEAR